MRKAKKKTDYHGGAKSGQRGETILKMFIEESGLTALKTQKSFIEYYVPKGSTKKRAVEIWKQKMCLFDPWGTQVRGFVPDFFIPEINYIVEQKYGTKEGTTEEKIFWDLEKIRAGVYDRDKSGSPFAYIFMGSPEYARGNAKKAHSHIFAEIIKQENLPCEVVFADYNNNNAGLVRWLSEKKEKANC